MNEGAMDIATGRLAAAFVFLVLLLVMVRYQGLRREGEIALAALRMTLQLVVMGYVLLFIFDQDHFIYPLAAITVMLFFAVRNVYARVQGPIDPRLKRVIALALVIGVGSTMLYFMLVVINLDPWYLPRYFVPISGMLVGNSMTGISLGTERLISGIQAQRERVEGALMLGATPVRATREVTREAFSAAILPTINSMVGMGIVFLPGMMTGQILAGASPVTAIQYQIAIMLGIAGAVSLTVFLLVRWGALTFFNERGQLL